MRALLCTLLIALLCAASPARAQWVLNPTTGTIGNTTPCTGTSLTRTFEVATPGTVADVDLGLDIDHLWRGDVRARLTSPAGTTVELITADTGASGNLDNYRIRLDDSAAVQVNTGAHAVNTATTAGRYADSVRPDNPLSAFNGQAANGTWSLALCDGFPAQDNGTLLRTTLFITPTTPPAPPALVCTVAQPVPLVWSAPGTANGWAAGTLVNGYSADTIPLAFAVTGATQDLIARNGVQTPVSSTELSPGGADHAVLLNRDAPNRTNTITLTANLGQAGAGVEGVQFTLLDVDRNGWTDRVSVAGSLDGTAVTPTLTPGLANRVDGSSITGTALTPSGSPESSTTITFSQPVDQVVLTYSNAPNANADPPGQVIGFFSDMRLCPLPVADLSAVKSVEVLDPASNGDFMVPGNSVLYKITVTHDASSNSDATDVMIADALPPTLQFVSAAQSGFTAGAFANTNCPGASCTVVFENGTLPPGTTGEIAVTALIR